VSSGNPTATREDLISQVKIGETTKEEIRQMFGQPTVMSRHSGGLGFYPGLAGVSSTNTIEIWNYTHMNVDTSPVTFIPIVGLFAGGSTSTMSQVTFTFDDKGIVRNVQTGHNQATAGPGASSTK